MNHGGHTWALVLAAGEGSRLRSLTTTSAGVAIPKQFCSLSGGLSLLHEALRRAEGVAAREHICTVVAQDHRQWWEPALGRMPEENVIVQPANRGTGNGVLFPLLHILERDPQARIVLLPSDHHVRDERTLTRSLQQAVAELETHPSQLVLLGLEPDEVDPELGYIVPGSPDGARLRTVERFVEKPSAAAARNLIVDGALWNIFIVAARAQTLLELYMRRFAAIVTGMREVVGHRDDPAELLTVDRYYRALPNIDFSRHVAQGSESSLRVLTVPPCGWSDLGTPARVAQVLRRLPAPCAIPNDRLFPLSGHLNLAVQHAQLHASQ